MRRKEVRGERKNNSDTTTLFVINAILERREIKEIKTQK